MLYQWKQRNNDNYRGKAATTTSVSSHTFYFYMFLGIPTLAYGVGSWMLVKFSEDVQTPKGTVTIYFLNKEDRSSKY